MDRKEFRRRLSQRLRWWCDPKDMAEILDDYEENFTAGMADGKTEEALCAEFGDPGEIARTLRREQGVNAGPWLRLAALAAAAVWFAACFLSADAIVAVPLRLPFVLALPGLLFYGLNGMASWRGTRREGETPHPAWKWLFTALCAYAALAALALWPVFSRVRAASDWWGAHLRGAFHQPLDWAVGIVLCSAVLAAAAACVPAVALWRSKKLLWPALWLGAGYMAAAGVWNGRFREVLLWAEKLPAYGMGMLQIALGLLLGALFGGAMWLCARREPAAWIGRDELLAVRIGKAAALALLGLWALRLVAAADGGGMPRRYVFLIAAPLAAALLLRGRTEAENAFGKPEKRVLAALYGVAGLAFLLVLLFLRPRLTPGAAQLLLVAIEAGIGASVAVTAAELYCLPGTWVFSALFANTGLAGALIGCAVNLAAVDDPAGIRAGLAGDGAFLALGLVLAAGFRLLGRRVLTQAADAGRE